MITAKADVAQNLIASFTERRRKTRISLIAG
jgi:hypothetical protein